MDMIVFRLNFKLRLHTTHMIFGRVKDTDNVYYCTKNQMRGLCVDGDMVRLDLVCLANVGTYEAHPLGEFQKNLQELLHIFSENVTDESHERYRRAPMAVAFNDKVPEWAGLILKYRTRVAKLKIKISRVFQYFLGFSRAFQDSLGFSSISQGFVGFSRILV